VCAHDLEQADGKCRLLLVKRQLADDAAARGEAQESTRPNIAYFVMKIWPERTM